MKRNNLKPVKTKHAIASKAIESGRKKVERAGLKKLLAIKFLEKKIQERKSNVLSVMVIETFIASNYKLKP